MYFSSRFQATCIGLLSKIVLSALLFVSMGMICNTALAQGTATGPFTVSAVGPGLIVLVGDAGSPIPIDLDPTGPPWSKSFFDDSGFTTGGGTLNIIETILNVGTEAWGDWHAEILGDPASASAPSFWSSVTSMEVNGSPITFTTVGVSTKEIWLDDFSMPVLPGDILTINKQIDVFSNTAGINMVPLVRLQQFPTPFLIPEPSACLLLAIGCTGLACSRRRKR